MGTRAAVSRSEEHTSELQSPYDLVCRLLLEKKKTRAHATKAGGTPASTATRMKRYGTPQTPELRAKSHQARGVMPRRTFDVERRGVRSTGLPRRQGRLGSVSAHERLPAAPSAPRTHRWARAT